MGDVSRLQILAKRNWETFGATTDSNQRSTKPRVRSTSIDSGWFWKIAQHGKRREESVSEVTAGTEMSNAPNHPFLPGFE